MKNTLFLALAFAFFGPKTEAATWLVGPTKPFKKPSQVVSLVASGDSVVIDPGIYVGDVCAWTKDDLTLLGASATEFAHLKSDGAAAQGKAIWVISGAGVRVENIEFSGCKVPDQNGAGIRAEGKSLWVEHCFFHENEMGILTWNDPETEIVIERSQFEDNGFGDGYSHNVYVGAVKKLTFRFNWSRRSVVGHLLKSRAATNLIFFNRLTSENGPVSREIDLPNGGTAIVVGNLIQQNADGKNGNIIGYGLEGLSAPAPHELFVAHNTIVNERWSGSFLQVAGGTALVRMVSNFFVGAGAELVGQPVLLEKHDNSFAPDVSTAFFEDAAAQNFRLKSGSPAIDAGGSAGSAGGLALEPFLAYAHPLGSEIRAQKGAAIDAGAYELGGSSAAGEPFSAVRPELFSIQNLGENGWRLQSATAARATIFDAKGTFVAGFLIQKGSSEPFGERLGAGLFFIQIEGEKGERGGFLLLKRE